MDNILETIRNLTTAIIPIIIAITFHEAAHGYAAYKLGDSTAKDMGRLTLNPAPHIDPFNTIFIPIIMFVLSNGSFIFGAAKPVPVNFNNLRHIRRDSVIVAAAGPFSNIVLVIISILLLKVIPNTDDMNNMYTKVLIPVIKMMYYSIYFNIFLAAFNLLPIPPLDGGRIVTSLLPFRYGYQFGKLEPYGFIIILGLWALGIINYVIVPIQYLIRLIIKIFMIPFGGI
ncbi:MAG: site-2 protease family protein [Nitrospirae bacterium]|nr:site-2 protease family protein [Nitrospirota bacterium]